MARTHTLTSFNQINIPIDRHLNRKCQGFGQFLTWLNLLLIVRFWARTNFCYCPSCLKIWHLLQKEVKIDSKIIISLCTTHEETEFIVTLSVIFKPRWSFLSRGSKSFQIKKRYLGLSINDVILKKLANDFVTTKRSSWKKGDKIFCNFLCSPWKYSPWWEIYDAYKYVTAQISTKERERSIFATIIVTQTSNENLIFTMDEHVREIG